MKTALHLGQKMRIKIYSYSLAGSLVIQTQDDNLVADSAGAVQPNMLSIIIAFVLCSHSSCLNAGSGAPFRKFFSLQIFLLHSTRLVKSLLMFNKEAQMVVLSGRIKSLCK